MPNTESNSYTILFSAILVVAVGVLLTLVFSWTNPSYLKSVELEKRQNILSAALGKSVDREQAESMFDQYITDMAMYTADGALIEDGSETAFTLNQAKEVKKGADEERFPMFKFQNGDTIRYVLGMRGTGLWGPVWGFIAIESDLNTVFNANFDHKSETPGLGAEIKTDMFEGQFRPKDGNAKALYGDDGSFKGIRVEKTGKVPQSSAEYQHVVDGISGGTITSNGVSDMLQKYLQAFTNYAEKNGLKTQGQALLVD